MSFSQMPLLVYGLRVIRFFHNRKRLKNALKTHQSLYAHNTADDTWSHTCSTTGSRIWSSNMRQAEPMHPTEFAGQFKRGKFSKHGHLLTLEGWTEVWLYTEAEFKEIMKERITDAVFKDLE